MNICHFFCNLNHFYDVLWKFTLFLHDFRESLVILLQLWIMFTSFLPYFRNNSNNFSFVSFNFLVILLKLTAFLHNYCKNSIISAQFLISFVKFWPGLHYFCAIFVKIPNFVHVLNNFPSILSDFYKILMFLFFFRYFLIDCCSFFFFFCNLLLFFTIIFLDLTHFYSR